MNEWQKTLTAAIGELNVADARLARAQTYLPRSHAQRGAILNIRTELTQLFRALKDECERAES